MPCVQCGCQLHILASSAQHLLCWLQGLVNTDPRSIAVPDQFVNMIPTVSIPCLAISSATFLRFFQGIAGISRGVTILQEVHGLTFSATPQQNINILTLGAANGKGGFFPKGGPPHASALRRALLLCMRHKSRCQFRRQWGQQLIDLSRCLQCAHTYVSCGAADMSCQYLGTGCECLLCVAGLLGRIRLPTGYNKTASGTNAYPRCNGKTSPQVHPSCTLGTSLGLCSGTSTVSDVHLLIFH